MSGMDVESRETVVALNADERRLYELGYKQELKRGLGTINNALINFSILSVITGVTGLYGASLYQGGPASTTYGWPLVVGFVLCVGGSLAEICSAFPTSGGLYFWASRLVPESMAPFASYITGWFNLLGQIAITGSVGFAAASCLAPTILLATGGAMGGGYVVDKYVLLGLYAGILFISAVINTFDIDKVRWVVVASGWVQTLVPLAVAVLVPTLQKDRAPASFVFATYNRDLGGVNNTGVTSDFYLFLIGLLASQYTFTGYDASAHMTEETANAETAGSYAMMFGIGGAAIVGWVYILGLNFGIAGGNIDHLFDPATETGGTYPPAQIMVDAFLSGTGSSTGATVLMFLLTLCMMFATTFCTTGCSRMVYAFARDGAIPGSGFWHKLNPKTRVPTNAVWGVSALAFLLGVPSLGSSVAFPAITSITTVGLYLSYGLPILFRLTVGRKKFVKGPFHLGPFSEVIGWISILWVLFITVVFVLPTAYPVSGTNLNYAPVMVGAVLIFSLSYWFLSARKWFKGPVANVNAKEYAY